MTRAINWTEEQLQFLSANRDMKRAVLTEAFNARFGTNFHYETIRGLCKRKGFHTGRTGFFEQGQKPWNTGKKIGSHPNTAKTQFKKGQKPINQKPIGHERICSKDGYVLVKTDQKNPYTGAQGWYRPKHIVEWENNIGPVPKGKVLRFIDGNKTNCDISNLELIDQRLNLRLNKNKVNEMPTELRPVATTICKLELASFDRKKELKNAR